MKRAIPLLLAVVLTTCGPAETPEQKHVPTVEKLTSDPARLKDLRQQCKTDRATRKRFYGDGNNPYAPPENPPKF